MPDERSCPGTCRTLKRLSTRYHGPEKAERQMREQFSKEERVTMRMRIEQIKEYGLS